MNSFMHRAVGTIAVVCVLAAPSTVWAGKWVVEPNPPIFGPGYTVTDHETGTIHTNTRKAAKRIARILNRAGFVDPGTGPCHDPSPGVQC